MANKKFSELDPASALTGAETVPVIQGGVEKRTTTQDIANTVGNAYTTVAPTGAAYTTVGAAITAGATKILVEASVTEAGSITIPADGVLAGLNQSVAITMPSGGNLTIDDRAKVEDITINLNTGKVVQNADTVCQRVVINKSSATGYLLELAEVRAAFLNGRIYDTATTLSTSRVVLRQIFQRFEENYCEIADAGTTAATAWFRTSRQGGDTGAVHVISKNYFYSTAAWASGSFCMNLEYADGSISENKFEGPVGRGTALKLEDYHETILSNYFVNFDTQILIPDDGTPNYSSVYRVEIIGNRLAASSGRNIDLSGYACSIVGNTISGSNQTIRINPTASNTTSGYGNQIVGNQIRSSNVSLGSNSQYNFFSNNTFISSGVSDSGTNNRFFNNLNGPADNYPVVVGQVASATISGAAAAELSVSGLDLNTHKAYKIHAYIQSASGGSSIIGVKVNGVTSATNYHIQRLEGDGATAGAARASGATRSLGIDTPASQAQLFEINIAKVSGGTTRISFMPMILGATSSAKERITIVHYNDTTNVTSFALTDESGSSYFDIGCTMSVKRLFA